MKSDHHNKIIDQLISENIMHWHREVKLNNEDNLPYYASFWVDEAGEKQEPENFWNPTQDPKNMKKVLNKLKEENIYITIITNEQGVLAKCGELEFQHPDSMEKAVCILGLMVKRIPLGETYFR